MDSDVFHVKQTELYLLSDLFDCIDFYAIKQPHSCIEISPNYHEPLNYFPVTVTKCIIYRRDGHEGMTSVMPRNPARIRYCYPGVYLA